MLNFREELNKIRQGRMQLHPSTNKIESLLKRVLSYYQYQDVSEIFDTKEINFCIDEKNNIIGKIYDMDEDVAINFSIVESFKSREEAQKALLDLEYKFKIEGYKIMFGKSAEKDGQFSVLI